MLLLTRSDIFSHEWHVGDFTDEGFQVGYVAVTFPSIGEVGALIVSKDHRGQGIGHHLVRFVSEKALEEGIQPIAFCNPLSTPLFESSGYEPMKKDCIPSEALELCAGCNNKPDDGGCCDTVYALQSEVGVSI